MPIIKFAIAVALLVCIFVATVFGQGRGGQDFETTAVTDDINEYHYGEIRNAVADHYDQRRSGGKDIDVDISIKKLEIEFEKNFFIAIKKTPAECQLAAALALIDELTARLASCSADRDQCFLDRDSCRTARDQCLTDRDSCRADRAECFTDRDSCRADRAECFTDRDSCRADRDQCIIDRDTCRTNLAICCP